MTTIDAVFAERFAADWIAACAASGLSRIRPERVPRSVFAALKQRKQEARRVKPG